jgi:hypothetical protein
MIKKKCKDAPTSLSIYLTNYLYYMLIELILSKDLCKKNRFNLSKSNRAPYQLLFCNVAC